MGIQPITYQLNFQGTEITGNGNEYEKTHNGKLIGTGLSAAISAIMLLATNSIIKKNIVLDEFHKECNNIIKYDGKKMSEHNTQIDNVKLFKKSKNALLAFLTLVTLGIGLGIGAIIDSSKNKHKAKRADLLANIDNKCE